jgi:hypothetical protein
LTAEHLSRPLPKKAAAPQLILDFANFTKIIINFG